MSRTESLSPVGLHSDQVWGRGDQGASPHQFLMRPGRLLWTEAIFRSRQSQERLRLCGKNKKNKKQRTAELPINLQWENLQSPHSQNGTFLTGQRFTDSFSVCLLLLPSYLESGQS